MMRFKHRWTDHSPQTPLSLLINVDQRGYWLSPTASSTLTREADSTSEATTLAPPLTQPPHPRRERQHQINMRPASTTRAPAPVASITIADRPASSGSGASRATRCATSSYDLTSHTPQHLRVHPPRHSMALAREDFPVLDQRHGRVVLPLAEIQPHRVVRTQSGVTATCTRDEPSLRPSPSAAPARSTRQEPALQKDPARTQSSPSRTLQHRIVGIKSRHAGTRSGESCRRASTTARYASGNCFSVRKNTAPTALDSTDLAGAGAATDASAAGTAASGSGSLTSWASLFLNMLRGTRGGWSRKLYPTHPV